MRRRTRLGQGLLGNADVRRNIDGHYSPKGATITNNGKKFGGERDVAVRTNIA